MPLKIVHDRTASNLPREKYEISFVGQYNDRGQCGGFLLLPEYQTVFGIQEQNYAVFCWDYQKQLTPKAVKLIAGCRQLVPFLVDIKVDRSYNDLNLLILSNNLPGIVYDDFYDTKNFRIFTINVKEALAAYPECTSYKPVYYPQPYSLPKPYSHPYPQKLPYYSQKEVPKELPVYKNLLPEPMSYVPARPFSHKETNEAPPKNVAPPAYYVPPSGYNSEPSKLNYYNYQF